MCENLLVPDPIEMVMTVEERFDITIPDAEAEKLRTMGQLYDFVYARVARGQEQICFTSAAFYRLRRALGEVCGVPRERVRPQARIEDLIPLNDRTRYWQELQARLGNLPRLQRPAWMVRWIEAASLVPLILVGLCTLILWIVLLSILGDTPPVRALVTSATVACLFIGVIGGHLVCREAYRRTKRYAVHVPVACATVRDTVYTLVGRHPAACMVSDTKRASDKEIWGTLCAIVGGVFDRPPDSLTKESTFV